MHCLQGRFGPLPEDLVAAIAAVDAVTHQEIVAHSATETLEQVRARLALH